MLLSWDPALTGPCEVHTASNRLQSSCLGLVGADVTTTSVYLSVFRFNLVLRLGSGAFLIADKLSITELHPQADVFLYLACEFKDKQREKGTPSSPEST